MSEMDESVFRLTPADGVPTVYRRMLDTAGTALDQDALEDAVNKYLRVHGSTLKNHEPGFFGEGMAIAKFPDRRKKPDHHYVTNAIKKIAIRIVKQKPELNKAFRNGSFKNASGWKKYIKTDGSTSWKDIPERYARRRYIMFLAQERAQDLRAVGFSEEQIRACAKGKNLPKFIRVKGKKVSFDVHHRVPLQCGGSNAIENLCLVDKKVHNAFFHKGDDHVLNHMKPEEVRDIVLVVPRDDVHVIAVGFNAFVHVYDETKGRSA